MGAPCLIRHGPLQVYVEPLDGCPDLERLATGWPSGHPFMWLDSARHHPVTGRWSLFGADPWLTLTAHGECTTLQTSAATHVLHDHPLQALQQTLRRYRAPLTTQSHARAIGLMGFLSYELNRWIEPTLQQRPGPPGATMPLLQWYAMRTLVLVDHLERRGWLLSVVDPHAPGPVARRQAGDALDALRDRFEGGAGVSTDRSFWASSLEPTTTQPAFERMVSRTLEAIVAGEIFQANVSQRFTAGWRGDPRALYQTLRRINPSPFACLLVSEGLAVVSCSPERLVRVQERWVDTRPIAGTRPRGISAEDDAVQSLELLLSEKERAEHLMLVDLARNDLGRIAEPGSVAVRELMTLEAYSHVIHIVSDVCARMRDGVDAADVIRAIFPGGTITGCPKVRCMEILQELEPVARGLYTGSLGYLGFDGTLDLNIAIRTIVLEAGRLSFHVGAGIVADSDPEREYGETLAKAAALLSALCRESASKNPA